MMVATSGKYQQIAEYDSVDEIDNVHQERMACRKEGFATKSSTAVAILVFTIVLSNFCTAFMTHRLITERGPRQETCSKSIPTGLEKISESYPIVDELPTVYTKFKWWTAWGLEEGARDDTDLPSAHVSDELWAGILPSHGIIAVNRTWARERNWPDSMYLPKDEHGKEKGVYLLEAYHLLHCVRMIRQSFIESQRGLPLTAPVGHTTHCFDALRQSIQCNADNTPLYTFADRTAGDNQARKCKSWDALRDFATEHSACYRDSDQSIPIRDHFGFCEDGRPYQDGQDGLP